MAKQIGPVPRGSRGLRLYLPPIRRCPMVRSNRREFLSGVMAGAAAAGLMARAGEAGAQGTAGKITPDDRAPLVIVDVQNDFLPRGALAGKEGDHSVPLAD